jgi:kynurenine formamidase
LKNLIILLCLIFSVSCNHSPTDAAKVLAAGRWIDLTWDFEESTVYWPTNVPFKHDDVSVQSAEYRDYQISSNDFPQWKKTFGKVPAKGAYLVAAPMKIRGGAADHPSGCWLGCR